MQAKLLETGVVAPELQERWKEWVAARPKELKPVIERYPSGTTIMLDGVKMWVIGYAEATDHPRLIISPVDPNVNAQMAEELTLYLCAHHLDEPAQKDN